MLVVHSHSLLATHETSYLCTAKSSLDPMTTENRIHRSEEKEKLKKKKRMQVENLEQRRHYVEETPN